MRALIIGAGVMGLSIGWQLARRGWEVEIFEKGASGKEASWSAAGMLAPYSEREFEEDHHLQLGSRSLALYPQFLQELNEDAKTELSLEKQGTLYVGMDQDDRAFLERLFDKESRILPMEWLSGKEAREIEPFLSPRVSIAIWIPGETHIQNRKLLISLKQAFQNQGGVLHEQCQVQRLWEQEGYLKGVWTQEPIAGEIVVNTAGAWADSIRRESSNPIYPNKGQILTLTMSEEVILTYMIRTPRVYLVPKSDGSLRIGATSEEVGFDQKVTGGGMLELLRAAFEVVPGIAYMQFREAEAKLRPASLNRTPCIEETELKGYFRAVGHGRAGILLAPYTAYEMVRKVCRSESMGNR
jgi:glycine oxidase